MIYTFFSILLKYGYVGKVKGLSSDPRFPKTRSDKLDNNSTTVLSVICGGSGGAQALKAAKA